MLTERGHPSVYAADLGMARHKDDEHLLAASLRARILVTNNIRDFELLHDAWVRWSRKWHVRPSHFGILTIPNGTTIERIIELLCDFADTMPLPITNTMYIWDGSAWEKHQTPRL